MRSLKQIEASRTNGAKSRGLAAEKTRLADERNSIRYLLLAGTVVLTGESTDRFLEMVQSLVQQWKPANETEAAQIATMAIAHWRMLRLAGLQKSAVELGMARQEGPAPNRALETLKDQDSSLAALQRNEMVYDRQYSRALRLLLDLKAQHHRPGRTPLSDLTSAGATWDPEPEEQPPPSADPPAEPRA